MRQFNLFATGETVYAASSGSPKMRRVDAVSKGRAVYSFDDGTTAAVSQVFPTKEEAVRQQLAARIAKRERGLKSLRERLAGMTVTLKDVF